MTKDELARAIQEATDNGEGFFHADAIKEVLDGLAAVLASEAAHNGVANFPGVGKIHRKFRKGRPSHLAKSGEIPPGWSIKASLSESFKEKVRSLAPEPTDG